MAKIETDPGTFIHGVRIGASQGARDDQNEAIEKLANRLAELFPEYDITIRFNTNQLGGGAWLKDNARSAQVGLGADLVIPEDHPHKRKFEAYLRDERVEKPPSAEVDIDVDERDLAYTVNLTVPAVDEALAEDTGGFVDRPPRARETFEDLEAVWKWFTEHVRRDGLHPPANSSDEGEE
jgi:hypothetical protein